MFGKGPNFISVLLHSYTGNTWQIGSLIVQKTEELSVINPTETIPTTEEEEDRIRGEN